MKPIEKGPKGSSSEEYLEQEFGGPSLMPPEAAGCAAVRLWNHHLNQKLAPAHFTFLMNKNESKGATLQAALEEALDYYEDRASLHDAMPLLHASTPHVYRSSQNDHESIIRSV